MMYTIRMDRHSDARRERIMLGVILVAALIVRAMRLGHQSFWVDEMLSIGTFTSPSGVSIWSKLLWDVHGPLFTLIMHFWSMVSSSEAWLRAPSAIAGVASVYCCYRWLVSIGRRDCALLGALFLALSPFNLYYSQELRFYSQLTFFLFLSLIVFQRFLKRPTYGNGALLGAALAATCFSHFSGGFLCIGLAVYLIITRRMRGMHLRAGAVAVGVVIVLISPWIYREIRFLQGIRIIDVSTIPVAERYRGEFTLSAWAYPYSVYAFSVGYSFGPSLREMHEMTSPFALVRSHGVEMLIVGCLFGCIVILGLIRAARTGMLALFLSITVVSVAGVSLLTKFNIKIFNVRYLMSAFPVFIAGLAFGVPRKGLRRYLTTAAVCIVMIYADWNHHFNVRYAKEDVRGAVRIIEKYERAGDTILAPSVLHTARYYYAGSNDVAFISPRYLDDTEMKARIGRMTANDGRVWYIRSRHWDTDPDDLIVTMLTAEAPEVRRWNLPGVVLLLFSHTPPAID